MRGIAGRPTAQAEHAALFILQHFIEPTTYRDLARLAALVQQGHTPSSLIPPRIRRVRSPGLL